MEVGELFLVLDMAKPKKMPGTKNKPIYKGPFVISSITDSHLLTKKGEKVTKYPIHLTRKYFPRLGEDVESSHVDRSIEQPQSSYPSTGIKNVEVKNAVSSNFTYGIPSRVILGSFYCLKEEIIGHIKKNTYLSPLYEELSNSMKKTINQPNSILLTVTKDASSFDMREEIIGQLVSWTEIAFSEIDPPRSVNTFNYVYQILYATVIDYLAEQLIIRRTKDDLKSIPYTLQQVDTSENVPSYTPVSMEWQISKCNFLGLPFEKSLSHAEYYIQQPLSSFVPLEQEPIEPDGNCFFRALSAVLTGSQNYFAKLRGEIYRFIGIQGAGFISRYLQVKFSEQSPTEYLLRSQMDADHIWATDVELVAVSLMLDVDLFVANYHFNSQNTWREIRWYRYHSNHINFTTPAIYLANFNNHFEPVTDLINGRYQSYFTNDSFSDVFILDDE